MYCISFFHAFAREVAFLLLALHHHRDHHHHHHHLLFVQLHCLLFSFFMFGIDVVVSATVDFLISFYIHLIKQTAVRPTEPQLHFHS